MLDRRAFVGATAGGVLAASWNTSILARDNASKLKVLTDKPLNAEPELADLVKSWRTPNDLFYVRSHAPAPKLNVKDFRLTIEGMVRRPFSLSLDELRGEYKKSAVVATMTCAGNRRNEHSLVRQVKGVPWGAGAIGNAQWGGARLSDLLKKAEVLDSGKYVWFEGVDEIMRDDGVIPFGASIPLTKAFGDTATMPGALVAYEMNGQPLPIDHGFPMRTVVPGFIGARSVKWLGKIVVSDRPSPNHYVANAYKLVKEGSRQEWDTAQPLGAFAINSVICTPGFGAKTKSGEVIINGYALPSGASARTIRQVEVSANDGKTWMRARLTSEPKPYCWQLWSAKIEIPAGMTTLTVRTTDSAGATQPKKVAWNLKGYMFNAWHQIPIDAE